MRTAVVRVNVDPENVSTPAQLRDGMATLLELAGAAGVDVIEDSGAAKVTAIGLCAKAFSGDPIPGVITFISRGTDDDAQGVLSAFGLTGDIVRTPGDDGFDIVHVTLREDDLEHIPESRVHTALEASLNCEVHIRTV
jgi:hypothetical protein